MSQFKVYVRRSPWSDGVEIGIVEDRGGKRYLWQFLRQTDVEIDDGSVSLEPTMRLQSWLVIPFFKALAEALDEQGIKTDSDAKLAGTMEATRAHLEDMRAIVFKWKKEEGKVKP